MLRTAHASWLLLVLCSAFAPGCTRSSGQEWQAVAVGESVGVGGIKVAAPSDSGWLRFRTQSDTMFAFLRAGERQSETYAASAWAFPLPRDLSNRDFLDEVRAGWVMAGRFSLVRGNERISERGDSGEVWSYLVARDRGPDDVWANDSMFLEAYSYARRLGPDRERLIVAQYSHRHFAATSDRALSAKASRFLEAFQPDPSRRLEWTAPGSREADLDTTKDRSSLGR